MNRMTQNHSNIESKLENKRIEMLYSQGFLTQSIGLLNAVLYWNISRDFISIEPLNFWLAAFVFVFLLRTAVQYVFYKRNAGIAFNPRRWELVFSAGALLSGILWGLAGSWLLPDGALAHHAFLGFIISGTTAAAAVAYCTSVWAVQAFLLPAVIPFAFAVFNDASKIHYYMSMLTFLYAGVVTINAVRLNKSILKSLRYQFENEKLLEEVRQAQATAAQTAKMVALSEMSGGVSHEINTPLTIINFETQSIRDICKKTADGDAAIKPITERIDAMVARMAKIVIGLKAFARETNREQPISLVSLEQIVSDAMDFCQGRIRSRGIVIETSGAMTDLRIPCNNYKIIQALLNLINNAADAVADRAAGRIDISTSEDDEYVHISITDNGRGIPENIQDKIMQPFFTTKEVGAGTGLGLSVALGIVQSHNGKMNFETSNKGTKFTISLPKNTKIHSIAV